MIKSTIFAVIFSHGFVLLPYSPVTVIMAFTCIYDSSSFSFGITNLALLETNNVVQILVFHINPPDTIIKYGKNEKLTFFYEEIYFLYVIILRLVHLNLHHHPDFRMLHFQFVAFPKNSRHLTKTTDSQEMDFHSLSHQL